MYTALVAKTLTPGHMFAKLANACNALTAFGVNMFANDKTRQDLVLSATTTERHENTCEACDGRGVIEATVRGTSGRYPGDRTRSYDRCDGRGRGQDARSRGGGRGRGRGSSNSDWRSSGGGHGDGYSNWYDRRDNHARSYDARSKGDGRDRVGSNGEWHRGGGGRGGGHNARGGLVAFSRTDDVTIFVAHAEYGEETSPLTSADSSSATMLGLRVDNWFYQPNAIMLGLSAGEDSPSVSMTKEVAVASSIAAHETWYFPHGEDDATQDTIIITLEIEPEQKDSDVDECLRLSHITENDSTRDKEIIPRRASTTGEVTVAFNVGCTGDAPHDATMLTLEIDPEEKFDSVKESLRRYKAPERHARDAPIRGGPSRGRRGRRRHDILRRASCIHHDRGEHERDDIRTDEPRRRPCRGRRRRRRRRRRGRRRHAGHTAGGSTFQLRRGQRSASTQPARPRGVRTQAAEQQRHWVRRQSARPG